MNENKIPNGFNFIKSLPNGFYGSTYLIRNLETQTIHICKIILKSRIGNEEDVERFLKYIEITKSISNEFLISFQIINNFEDQIILVRPFIEGLSLTTYTNQNLQNDHNVLFAQWKIILRMVRFLHTQGILPIFIKPNNIFIGQNKCILITDIFPPPYPFNPTIHRAEPFDVGFLAPEVFNNLGFIGPSSDIWSLGILLWFLVQKKLPWNLSNIMVMFRQIKNADLDFIDIPLDLLSIFNLILKLDQSERSNIDKIIKFKPGIIGIKKKQISPLPLGPLNRQPIGPILKKTDIYSTVPSVRSTLIEKKNNLQFRRRIIPNDELKLPNTTYF